MSVQNPRAADRDLVVRLHMLVNGLPGAMRVKYFRNVYFDVHVLAKRLMLQGKDYDAALRQATQFHLPHPNRANLKLLWHERRNLGRYLRQTLVTRLTSATRLLVRRRQARGGKLWLSRSSLEAISSYKQLQADLTERHPSVTFYWSSLTELGPGCIYLGCVEFEDRTLYVIARGIQSDVESLPQTRLALLGILIEALTHRRSFSIFEAAAKDSTNQFRLEEVHTQSIYWNQHEVLLARYENDLPDALAAELETLCVAWSKNQGCSTPFVVEVSEENHAADVRAVLPTAAMWEAFGVSPVEGKPYTERADDEFKLFGRVFRLPYIAPELLTAIFAFVLIPVAAFVSLLLTVLALILSLSLSLPVGLLPGLLGVLLLSFVVINDCYNGPR